jgi:hypothetical protein
MSDEKALTKNHKIDFKGFEMLWEDIVLNEEKVQFRFRSCKHANVCNDKLCQSKFGSDAAAFGGVRNR